jgi:hypothetical protein
MSKQSGVLIISEPYRIRRPVTEIVFFISLFYPFVLLGDTHVKAARHLANSYVNILS